MRNRRRSRPHPRGWGTFFSPATACAVLASSVPSTLASPNRASPSRVGLGSPAAIPALSLSGSGPSGCCKGFSESGHWLAFPLELGDGGPNRVPGRYRLLLALVFASRPEETPQAVFPAAWHDVDVQVGDALADAVVYRHENPVGPHAALNRPGKQPRTKEQRANQCRRKLLQSFVVLSGNQQAVAGKQRALIQKRQGMLILEDHMGRARTAQNFAEYTNA